MIETIDLNSPKDELQFALLKTHYTILELINKISKAAPEFQAYLTQIELKEAPIRNGGKPQKRMERAEACAKAQSSRPKPVKRNLKILK